MTSLHASPEDSVAERNARDLCRIYKFRDGVSNLLNTVALSDPLEHPDSRWHPSDLRQFLRGTLLDLAAEEARAHEPLLTPGSAW